MSAEGIAASTRQAVRFMAQQGLGSPLPPESKKIRFGIPEVTLIGLYAAGYFGHKHRSSIWKKRIRWGTMLTGMLVLGFVYTAPFTISQVISLLSGYWPDWHNNLYWYLLIGGIIFRHRLWMPKIHTATGSVHLARSRNAWRRSPAQNCTARAMVRFFHLAAAWTGLHGCLVGACHKKARHCRVRTICHLFDLRGGLIEVVILLIIVLASLLLYRPFCNYLCPLDPVYDFIAESRRWVREGWQAWKK
jgi:NosR/NirI family transcriptional regulator, nitrous oxide reductase regulator